MDEPRSFYVEVVGGADHGARLVVDKTVRTIGRAHDADLVLRDVSVSRTHAQVFALEAGIQVAVCAGAAAIVVDGRSLHSCEARPGERLTIGKTLLLVGSDAAGSAAAKDFAVHDLVVALDGSHDRAALNGALQTWASTHVKASKAGSEEIVAGEVAAEHEALGYTVEPDGLAGSSVITVEARAEFPIRLSFACPGPPSEVTDSIRRTLVIATRLYASALARVVRLEVAAEEKASLRALSIGSARSFLGESPAARDAAKLIGRLAASEVTVLLDGETGTGKTFVARLIHESSLRAKEPFRVINCAAIPDSLVESELFGHERGAFTGAANARPGAFEAAGAGTVLLDEIGELPIASQAKLLTVLEEKRFERVGSNRSIPLRARIIAATNRDLQQMVGDGRFRSDLYFRIAILTLRVPPLRERGDDLMLLAARILSDLAPSAGRRVEGFSPPAIEAIRRYAWPGNVRELRNAIERALVLGDGAWIEASDLPETLVAGAPLQPEDASLVRLPLDLPTLERRAVEAALRATGGNRGRAAVLLGISRNTLGRKLQGGEGGASGAED
jgi:two-component system response regulator HydG